MNMKRLLSGFALTCAMVGTAQADDLLASGPVYGGPLQTRVACQVFNAGSVPITFVKTQISSQALVVVPLTFNNCVALAPNRTCTFQAVADNQGFSCKVVTLGSATQVRGTMAALNASAALLSEAALR